MKSGWNKKRLLINSYLANLLYYSASFIETRLAKFEKIVELN